ncbi:phospholipid-transporting ATPase ABCA1 [Anopheles marshallii]|uniref:phospholipid-transporting ATPase ABCA1 n=1 Tax=Anopheles marshallii TaxID=1521116 RepID=UPI00237A42AC|nr:phospholipid-transporting ATPase ABCA1 [Anopheles marshallii]
MSRLLKLFCSTALIEKRRHVVRSLVHLLLPIAVTIFVIHVPQSIIASNSSVNNGNDVVIQDDLADYFPGELVNKIYYTPRTELTETLMETVRQRLYIVDERVVPCATDTEMEFALLDNPYICFGLNFQNISGKSLQFVIRTKNNNFRTDFVYSQDVFSSYQKRDNEYVESGFLALQNAVDQSYVSMLAKQNKNNDVPRLQVAYGHIPVDDSRGPQTPPQTIHLMTGLAIAFSIMVIFALLLPMVEERANGTREHLKIACSESYWKEAAQFILNFPQFFVVFWICLAIALGTGFWGVTVAQFLYLLIFSIFVMANLITFAFFLSTTLESQTVALAVAPIIFFGPYFLSMSCKELVSLFCLFPVVGLCYAGLIFDVFKSSGHLVQALNLFTVGYPGLDNISLFLVLVYQLLGTVLWLFLWFYVSNVWPGRYGTPKSKGFFFSKSYWIYCNDGLRNTNKINAESEKNLQRNSSYNNEVSDDVEMSRIPYMDEESNQSTIEEYRLPCEETPTTAAVKNVVRISNLNKTYKGRTGGAKIAVTDFSLSIYSHSVTVLLGHNGAGKTTTMNIITGLLPPTSGTIVVDGEHDPNRYRQRIGFCPQHNVLFSFLNCRQHLEFFGRLRGLNEAEAQEQVRIVLGKVNLRDKSESLVHTLSGGMKRRLCLANAIIGNTKLLILDEPTSGLDPESRRDIWDALLKLRQDHTILLTTHFMEEADVLADWVAIMEYGKLLAFGSPLYLKRKYGKGYTLKVCKGKHFDQERTWNVIRDHVPNAIVRDSVQEILAVTLPYDDVALYAAMLKTLEEERASLGIETIGMADATLEEVFLNSCTIKKELQHHQESVDGPMRSANSEKDSMKIETLSETGNTINVYKAIWRKKSIHIKRNKHIYSFLLSLPLLVTACCFWFTSSTIDAAKTLPGVTLDAEAIHQARGVFVINHAADSTDNHAFGNLAAIQSDFERSFINGVRMVVKANVSLLDMFQQQIADDYTDYRDQVVVGIECNDTSDAVECQVLYNNNLIHSTGISESVFTTLCLRFYADESGATVNTGNIPSTRKQLIDIKTPFYFTELISIAFFLYMPIYLLMPLQENLSGFRQLQNITRKVYFTGTYFFDMVLHTLVCSLVIALVYFVDHTEVFDTMSKCSIFVAILIYGYRALVVIYIISHCVESSNTAITIMSYLMIVGVAGVLMLCNGYDDIENNVIWIAIFLLVPEFGLKFKMRLVYENQKILTYQKMAIQQNRAAAVANKLIYPEGFLFLLIEFIELVALTYLLSEVMENIYRKEKMKISKESAGENIRKAYRHISRSISREDERSRIQNRHPEAGGRDETDSPTTPSTDDVDSEVQLVNKLISTKENIEQYAIIVKGMKKMYSHHEAVKSVSFAVKKGECFGLLGMNGAGKTTVFQMLSRNLPASEGTIFLQDCEVREADELKYRHQYGYCPQFDALLDFMTVYELVDYFAQLKGVKAREVLIENWLVRLDILQYKDHTLNECSGGTKRKVNTILALLGGPPVVLLDEPTTGVDPKSRHFLWKTIKTIQRKNQTIVLTSHSMDECEELCNRLTIMVDGRLQCVGTIPDLKQRHGQGYNLWIKLKIVLIDANNAESVSKPKPLIDAVIEGCKASLQEEHQGLLKFTVSPSLELSELFRQVIELEKKHSSEIENYSIYECSLEEVFLHFRQKKKTTQLQNV